MYALRSLFVLTMVAVCLAGCAPDEAGDCPLTEPVRATPPDDPAVSGTPREGYYFINPDRSIWASAWWFDQAEKYLTASEEGVKIGWFRPDGARLDIQGQRLDARADPLEVHVPCCYPTRFQSSALYFPSHGCWQINAQAGGSEIEFVVWVDP